MNIYSPIGISLGYSNEILVLSSDTKITILTTDEFDLIMVYDVSERYASKRNLPYITGMILDENSSRIIISTSDGLLRRIDYSGYILAGKNEIVVQEVQGVSGGRLSGIYFALDLALYDDNTLVVGGASEDGITLWNLEIANSQYPVCTIDTSSYIQDVVILTDYDLIGFIDGKSAKYLVFTRCVDGESVDVYRMDFYSKDVSIRLSWNSTWNLLAISSERGIIQLWTIGESGSGVSGTPVS